MEINAIQPLILTWYCKLSKLIASIPPRRITLNPCKQDLSRYLWIVSREPIFRGYPSTIANSPAGHNQAHVQVPTSVPIATRHNQKWYTAFFLDYSFSLAQNRMNRTQDEIVGTYTLKMWDEAIGTSFPRHTTITKTSWRVKSTNTASALMTHWGCDTIIDLINTRWYNNFGKSCRKAQWRTLRP